MIQIKSTWVSEKTSTSYLTCRLPTLTSILMRRTVKITKLKCWSCWTQSAKSSNKSASSVTCFWLTSLSFKKRKRSTSRQSRGTVDKGTVLTYTTLLLTQFRRMKIIRDITRLTATGARRPSRLPKGTTAAIKNVHKTGANVVSTWNLCLLSLALCILLSQGLNSHVILSGLVKWTLTVSSHTEELS